MIRNLDTLKALSSYPEPHEEPPASHFPSCSYLVFFPHLFLLVPLLCYLQCFAHSISSYAFLCPISCSIGGYLDVIAVLFSNLAS
jgi:hypothetical protein